MKSLILNTRTNEQKTAKQHINMAKVLLIATVQIVLYSYPNTANTSSHALTHLLFEYLSHLQQFSRITFVYIFIKLYVQYMNTIIQFLLGEGVIEVNLKNSFF